MKLCAVIAAPAVATILGAASPAAAANWVTVTTDPDSVQYAVDTSTIQVQGGYVSSWEQMTAAKNSWDKAARKWYRISQVQRLDSCRDKSFSLIAYIHRDDRGGVAGHDSLPQDQWRFQSPSPGSVAEIIQNQICAFVARRAALKPALNEGPSTQTDWDAAGYDPTRQVDYAVDLKTIGQLKDGSLAIVERSMGRVPQRLRDGEEFQSAYALLTIDCAKGLFAVRAEDDYDSAGALIFTSTIPAVPTSIAPGTIAAGVSKIACEAKTSVQAGRDAADAPQISSGTAWLGPKGYLVTANHVVEGGAAFALFQDGKEVGRAELVLTDPANDLAVLRPKLAGGARPAIPFAEAPALLGERVFTLGYPAPGELGLSIKMTSGEVSALRGDDVASHRTDDVRLLQISVPIQPGNSGGPLIDPAGRAVGVVVSGFSGLTDDTVAQNVNYAVKVGYLRNLMEGLPDIGGHYPARSATTMTGEVAALKGAVFLLMVSSKPVD